MFGNDSFLVIWTTTPWTLIANVAVAVHPDFEYSYIKTGKGNLIIANVRLPVLDSFGIEKYEVLKEFKGKDLEGLVYDHPFGLRQGKVVTANYVSGEDGTGLVHTAPGHGAEDYLTGLKHNLEIVMPVDTKGNFDATAGEFKGVNVHEANKPIIEKLRAAGHLLLADEIRHSYPHCWRCKNPIIFRATNQWFMRVDHNDLRKKLLKTIENNVEFIPHSGRERISSMIESRPDWCLSRQRYWGVPIPSLICRKCNEEFLEPKVIEKWLSFIVKEGTDSWFIRDVKDFLPVGFKCSCGGDEFDKGVDILDVWFDSGASSQAVLKKREDVNEFPCSLYLEGSDQHRGWFQASLWVAMGVDGVSPFKSVLTHGFVVDGDGRKMSKSMGNVIAPAEILKNFGADILRLWAASSDYNEDIRISKQILQRLSEAYRKIRNTARFILSNLYDYDPSKDGVEENDLKLIDKWILSRLEKVKVSVTRAYDAFEFHKAFKGIYDFCNEDLSMCYMDMVKGRLYTARADSKARRASQTAMYRVVRDVVKLMAPILPFTAEDIWSFIPKSGVEKDSVSVHMQSWPSLGAGEAGLSVKDAGDVEYLDSIMAELVPEVTKLLEEKRSAGIIGSSFDAKINLLTKDEKRYTRLKSLKADLSEILKVSEVTVRLSETSGPEPDVDANNPDAAIVVDKADGKKCERCWNYSTTVGTHSQHTQLCGKCVEAIQGGNRIEEKT
jgi:isoleucyl-tRNA synthetase